jgi:hypothetical protein
MINIFSRLTLKNWDPDLGFEFIGIWDGTHDEFVSRVP